MKRTLLAAATLFAFAPVTSMAVPTVYSYTGNFYILTYDNALVPGAYTTDMRLTGSVTLNDAIAPNSEGRMGWDSPEVLAASFNDGRFEYTKANANVGSGTFFIVETDATGAMSYWGVGAIRENPAPGIREAGFTTVSSDVNFCCDIVRTYAMPLGTYDYDINRSFVRGTWTVAPVPEPEIWAMLLSGLGLVGWAVRRKRGQAA